MRKTRLRDVALTLLLLALPFGFAILPDGPKTAAIKSFPKEVFRKDPQSRFAISNSKEATMKRFWTIDGKVIVDSQGRPIYCEHCPCEGGNAPGECPCNIPRIQEDGDQLGVPEVSGCECFKLATADPPGFLWRAEVTDTHEPGWQIEIFGDCELYGFLQLRCNGGTLQCRFLYVDHLLGDALGSTPWVNPDSLECDGDAVWTLTGIESCDRSGGSGDVTVTLHLGS